MSKKKQLPKVNLYRNISISFIVFTAILFLAVMLFFYNQANIIITSDHQEINLSFNVEVIQDASMDELSRGDIVSGYLESREKTGQADFEVLSTKTLSSELVGQVKIVNNLSRNQPLLRTTQLQAANGVIVRTNEQVVVPAGGSVVVAVYPKDRNNFSDIDPGQLTIIKLNPGSQDKVYAIAENKLTDSPREARILSISDINRAKEELSDQLITEVKEELNLTPADKVVAQIVDFSSDKEIGTETDSFKLQLTAEVKSLIINNEQLASLIGQKVEDLNLKGVKVDEINVIDLDYLIISEDEDGSILVKVNYVLRAKLDVDNPILDKDLMVNKTIAEIREELLKNDLIKEVEVNLYPYWSKKLPSDVDKINIIIK